MRFLVAGSGTAEEELREQATRLGLDEHGTFLGWIGDDVLHSLYRIADLTVVPSIYEPFGLVALEAMASGCPCLVADTGGLREVVPNEDVGLRFRSRDPRSLATMAERLLTDEELRDRLVAEASEHVLTFDWADVARQVAAVYATSRQPAQQRVRAALPAPDVSRSIMIGRLTLSLALVLVAAPPASPPRRHPRPPWRDGRERQGAFAEESLAAYKNAARHGFVLEVDAKLTEDRVPVADPRRDARPHDGLQRRGAHLHARRAGGCRTDVLGSPAARCRLARRAARHRSSRSSRCSTTRGRPGPR